MLLLALGSVGTLLLAAPVLVLTWWCIWTFVFIILLMLNLLTGKALVITTWTVFGLLFVAYLTVNREQLETLKFDEEGPAVVAAQFAAHVAGYGELSLFMMGPNTVRSYVKVVSQLLLIGPALVGFAFRVARASIAASWMNVDETGQALSLLLEAGKRVSIDVLSKKTGTQNPPRLMRELLLIDGVVFLNSADPSLTTTDSLQATVGSAIAKTNESD